MPNAVRWLALGKPSGPEKLAEPGPLLVKQWPELREIPQLLQRRKASENSGIVFIVNNIKNYFLFNSKILYLGLLNSLNLCGLCGLHNL